MPPATIPPKPVHAAHRDTETPVPAKQFGRVINITYLPRCTQRQPSRYANKVSKVPHGQVAGLFSITSDGNWYKATYRGKTGYVKSAKITSVTLVGVNLAAQFPRIIVLARAQQHVEVWDHQRT